MRDSIPTPESWLGPLEQTAGVGPLTEELASVRLWRAFMTTRIMVALVVVLLQSWFMLQNHLLSWWPLALCLAYLAQTAAVRFLARPKLPGRAFESQWSFTIGFDVLVFSGLQFLQLGGINYTPLFALPLLLASVLGSISLALGTAAAITLLLLGEAWWLTLTAQTDSSARFLQVGLSGIGFFVLSFLTYQVAMRLARQEQLTRSNQQAARVQTEVNELVIENLPDGVLVIDSQGIVRAANPAAQRLLGGTSPALALPFQLGANPAWLALAKLALGTLASGQPQHAELMIGLLGNSTCQVRASTRQTANTGWGQAPLCVMFLEDLREVEARLRTEKLAAMGRMSAAVAHEIRNPLAAIAQANELLDEDLTERSHKQLTLMVRQNAQRLDQIVEDILNISRVQHQGSASPASALPVDEELRRICRDWALQNGGVQLLQTSLQLHFEAADTDDTVVFEQAHLRRVLVNLLDNAWRYASRQSGSIQISSGPAQNNRWLLQIWSDGAPLEWSVQRHLFEPFFSSESRSSGLGLYICRELCERHAASIGYQRAVRGAPAAAQDGNEFFIFLQCAAPNTASFTAPLFAQV